MSTKKEVLEILLRNEDEYISGEEIAKRLDVSRTAIWKAMNELKKEGHDIQSIAHKGYAYKQMDILTEEGVRFALGKIWSDLVISIIEQIDSTNKALKQKAAEDGEGEYLLVAKEQKATRGRFGRSYFAEKDKGLYFSLLLHPQKYDVQEPTLFTILAALAVVKAIKKLLDKKAEIKWVNDIYLDGKKVCGILSEAVFDLETQTISSVVIGIGINFSFSAADFPEELKEKAGALFYDEKPSIVKNQLLAEIVKVFSTLLNEGTKENWIADYRKSSFVLGKEVTYEKKGTLYSGRAVDIGDNGELIVERSDGQRELLFSGEISLKTIEGLTR